MSHLSKAQSTESEVPIKGPAAPAISATIPKTSREFEFLTHLSNSCYSSHKISLGSRGISRLRCGFAGIVPLIRLKRDSKKDEHLTRLLI